MTNLNPAPHFGLVLDCADPERLAEFWAEAHGYANVGSAGVYVALYPREGNGPKLLLQRVTEPKATKNRMHLDIEVPGAPSMAALHAKYIERGGRFYACPICVKSRGLENAEWVQSAEVKGVPSLLEFTQGGALTFNY